MHLAIRVTCGVAALALTAATAQLGARPSSTQAPTAPLKTAKPSSGFELTVDSIMRGPKLVGYPPTGLRWSGDSTDLYFEWRLPDDDEAVDLGGRRATAAMFRDGSPTRSGAARRRSTAHGTRRAGACSASIAATSC